jgi:hypothetical protein
LRTRPHPACDRHTNLQMVPSARRGLDGEKFHTCPVPTCRRCYNGDTYFDLGEASTLWEITTPKNPQDAARVAFLNAIRREPPEKVEIAALEEVAGKRSTFRNRQLRR